MRWRNCLVLALPFVLLVPLTPLVWSQTDDSPDTGLYSGYYNEESDLYDGDYNFDGFGDSYFYDTRYDDYDYNDDVPNTYDDSYGYYDDAYDDDDWFYDYYDDGYASEEWGLTDDDYYSYDDDYVGDIDTWERPRWTAWGYDDADEEGLWDW